MKFIAHWTDRTGDRQKSFNVEADSVEQAESKAIQDLFGKRYTDLRIVQGSFNTGWRDIYGKRRTEDAPEVPLGAFTLYRL